LTHSAFPEHITEFLNQVGDRDYSLIVIDTLTSFGGNINTNDQGSVRQQMLSICAVAEKLKTAILGLTHLKKATSENMMYDVIGSVSYTTVPRLVIGLVQNDGHEDSKLAGQGCDNVIHIGPIKANVSRGTGSFVFNVNYIQADKIAGLDTDDTQNSFARITYSNQDNRSVQDIRDEKARNKSLDRGVKPTDNDCIEAIVHCAKNRKVHFKLDDLYKDVLKTLSKRGKESIGVSKWKTLTNSQSLGGYGIKRVYRSDMNKKEGNYLWCGYLEESDYIDFDSI
jgi:hypothetical protein